jgi:ATP-binding cassette, subfamily B, heavy metal transporter
VKQQAYIEIAEQTFGHLHSLSLQWHLKKKMGNVIRSMDRGTDAANNLITYLFLYLVPAIGKLRTVLYRR